MRVRVLIFILLAVVLGGLLWYSQRRTGSNVVSGVIEADEVRLGSRVGGRVARVLTDEGHVVQKGEKLVELEPYDILEKAEETEQEYLQAKANHDKLTRGYRPEEIAQAQSRVAQLQARLEELEHGPRKQEIQAAVAEVAFAQAEFELAQQNYTRTKNLAADDAATKQRLDQVTSELRSATARVQSRQEQLELLNEGTRPEQITQARAQLTEAGHALQLLENGYRDEEIAAAYSAMQAADAARRAVQAQVQELTILAPLTGVVEAVELEPGDLLGPNVPGLSLLDMSHLWVRAFVPENHLGLVIGQKVPVTVDSFPGQRFTGKVIYVAHEAEFTPSNVQTPEERSKQVFRIKVELEPGQDKLRPGMAADVWLEQSAP